MFELNNIVRKNILSLKPYSSARDEFSGTEGIFLDANENPYGTYNRYPDPYQLELKSLVAKEKGIELTNIFVGNGSDEVIDLLFRIFCQPGTDKALTFSPTYGMYEVSAAINDVRIIKVPLNQNFDLESDAISPYLNDEHLKLICICSPNNPTGNTFSKPVIEEILTNFNSIVLVDEAYIDFSKEESLICMIEKYPNLVVSQTMSKAWGLAAARVGFAYANAAVIKLMNKVKPPYNISGPNQKNALITLENREQYERNLRSILIEKALLKKALESMQIVLKVFPSEANFFLVRFENADFIYNKLVEEKIIVRNRNTVVENCIRITVGTPRENQKLIEELKKIENEKSIIYR